MIVIGIIERGEHTIFFTDFKKLTFFPFLTECFIKDNMFSGCRNDTLKN
jgi:hypothetical protein